MTSVANVLRVIYKYQNVWNIFGNTLVQIIFTIASLKVDIYIIYQTFQLFNSLACFLFCLNLLNV